MGFPLSSSPSADALDRFVMAQTKDYAIALAEIRSGYKQSHWMWYIFPQIQGLGFSEMAQTYGITDVVEAQAYLQHPLLGPRLVEITEAVLTLGGLSAYDIFGSPDDLKLRSCCTLFTQVSPPGSVFEQVLTKYFDGQPDAATLRLLSP
ncbi:MAG: hypothetical protein RLZZ597_151 [Cyanobacteriota bacterium]|jgi:uncharacterized protein (DUF1810 family)